MPEGTCDIDEFGSLMLVRVVMILPDIQPNEPTQALLLPRATHAPEVENHHMCTRSLEPQKVSGIMHIGALGHVLQKLLNMHQSQ